MAAVKKSTSLKEKKGRIMKKSKRKWKQKWKQSKEFFNKSPPRSFLGGKLETPFTLQPDKNT